MINTLATLLGFQLLGEAIAFGLHAPVPGPVLGMALLLAWLIGNDRAATAIRPTGLELLRH
ncbi:MAG: CidA/LrgA family protein, partial [Burkholderiaceae bacterium]